MMKSEELFMGNTYYNKNTKEKASIIEIDSKWVRMDNGRKIFIREFLNHWNPSSSTEESISTIASILSESIDRVKHPSYYKDPSGVECIDIVRHRDFNIGNAIKYLWRVGLKDEGGVPIKDKTIEDLKKAIFYINDEIKMIENDWKS